MEHALTCHEHTSARGGHIGVRTSQFVIRLSAYRHERELAPRSNSHQPALQQAREFIQRASYERSGLRPRVLAACLFFTQRARRATRQAGVVALNSSLNTSLVPLARRLHQYAPLADPSGT